MWQLLQNCGREVYHAAAPVMITNNEIHALNSATAV